jgi:hypothetical protein
MLMGMNFGAAIAETIESGADQTVAKTGGGEQNLPAAGMCNVRLVAYIELGKHEKSFAGSKPKLQDQVALTFELSGKNHPPIETDSGPMPQRITIYENLSLHEKARFFKLFGVLNYKGTAKHCAELADQTASYRARVIHREYTGRDGKPRKVAELYDKALGAYTIGPARVEVTDEDGQPTGEFREVKVAPALSDKRIFLWNAPPQYLMGMWDTLFIDGEYPERKNEAGEVTAPAKSKNQFQLKIASAKNYAGSPIQQLLANGGKELDVGSFEDEDQGGDDEAQAPAPAPAAPKAPAKPAAKGRGKDPLADIAF